ncbi:MAG: CvpA family protein [Paludibacteraceae bacterium]|nr:CvpA family protein [Prevotellaceae bacterium]
MSALDILILLVLVFGVVRGIWKGFVLELAGFVGIILSIYAARFYSGLVLGFLESFFGVGKEVSPIFAFLLTFLLAMLAFHFLALLADKFVSLIALGWLNKLLGGFLSLVKYILILSILFNLFDLTNTRLDLLDSGFQTKSKLYQPMKKIAPTILPCIDRNDITGKLHGVFSIN